jgi:hypothetical protein
LPGPDGVAAFNSQIEVLGDEQLSWTQDVDLFGNVTDVWDLAWTVTPPDAQHGTLDIEVTWEARFKTYDAVGLSEAESVRHVYEDGQVTHIGPRLVDSDGSLYQHDMWLKDRFTGDQNPNSYDTQGDALGRGSPITTAACFSTIFICRIDLPVLKTRPNMAQRGISFPTGF